MSQQTALPLRRGLDRGPSRIVTGSGNLPVVEALRTPDRWPYRTAVLTGPARSGKSLMARWFAQQGRGEALDEADRMDETDLFHRWNRAQESGTPLLLVAQQPGWEIALPDLRSRLGAALHLEIGPPDDDMACNLILSLAEEYGLALDEGAPAYLVPRCTRSYAGLEKLVQEIDRLSLERKQPATMAIWRAALEAVMGSEQPKLL